MSKRQKHPWSGCKHAIESPKMKIKGLNVRLKPDKIKTSTELQPSAALALGAVRELEVRVDPEDDHLHAHDSTMRSRRRCAARLKCALCRQ